MNMFPVYKEMNSYPYQRNGVPSSQCYYHPSWEAVTPQMKEDTSSSSCTHESWPHHYGYPVPMQCHNCCNHSQHPGYYNFRPPCSHFPPPPPPPYQHFYGGYPPYPQYYPMYYGPPPHYSMELPRYEYDKSVPRDHFHCCGCMNHPHNVKGGSNVKIEEHDPDAEKKKSEPSSPARASNFPYPIMWLPPEYKMDKEQPRRLAENEGGQHVLPYVKKPQVQQRSIETEAQENEGTKPGSKPHQNVQSTEQDPNVRYGWFPLDINKLKQLMEGGDAKQACDQEKRIKDEKKAPDVEYKDDKQQSYPLFWMPCDEKEKGDVEGTTGGKATDKLPYKVLSRKIDQADNEAEEQSTAGVGTMGADKKRIVKTIPVKQLDESAPNVSKKEEENKQDLAENVTSKQSSSTAKKPKLPPICLRIDPPKKNKGNGSSRSPSPPGDKKQQDSDDSDLKRKPEQPHKGINIKDAEKKTYNQNQMEVLNGAEEDKKGSEILKDNIVSVEKNAVQHADSDQSDDVKSGDYGIEAQIQEAKENWQERKQERKVMSEAEAAVAIQTAYRGYNVRKSEPIKKLNEIAKVHEDAIQMKRHLEDLESRAPVDVKEKTVMGETIMNLLLKLDTMQGLHHNIRDVRKSVAKELISLQEKLDSITSQQSIVLAQDTSLSSAVEEPLGSEIVIGSTGQPDKYSSLDGDGNKKIVEEDIFSSCDHLSSSQSCQTLPCHGVSGHEISETSDASLVSMESQEGPFNNNLVPATTSDGDVAPLSLDLKMNEELGACEAVQEKSATKFEELIADTSSFVDTTSQNHLDVGNKNEEAELVSELPQEVDDIADENVLLNANKNQEENLMSELPQDVNEEPLANVSIIEDSAVENDNVPGNENHESDVLSKLPRDVVEEDEKDVKLIEQPCNAGPANENHESDVLSELPRDVVEEDEKDVKLTKQPCEDASSTSKMEAAQEDLPSKVSSDDGKVLTEIENSKVDHLTKKLEVESEDIMVVENETYKPFELSSIETVSGQEAESISSSTSIKTSKETSEISSEVDVRDHENRSENVEQELPVETLVPELEQQSKEVDGVLGRSLENQSSAAAHEMEEQVDQKIIEENEKLKAMLETLLAAGKEQQEVISNLNGKVKDLEKKLGSSKKKKSAKHPPRVRISRRLCGKPDNNPLRESTMGIAS